MTCRRCPHHVRHGFQNKQSQIEFKDLCGLKIKEIERAEADKPGPKKTVTDKKAAAARNPRIFTETEECMKVPFSESFEYRACDVYIETFKSSSQKNDVVPTKDFQYSEVFSGGSITDMELL